MQLEYHVLGANGDYEDYGEHLMYIFKEKDKAVNKKRELEEKQEQDRAALTKKIKEMEEELFNKYKIKSKEIEDLYEVINDEDYEEYRDLAYECDCVNKELPECTRYFVEEYGVNENGKVVKYSRMYEEDRGFTNYYDLERCGDRE
jgi:hypothetical protein